jgi:hypothetical protein
METIRVMTEISADGSIHIDAHTGLPPGRVEVVIAVHPLGAAAPAGMTSQPSIRNIPPHRSGAMHGDWTREALVDEMRDR